MKRLFLIMLFVGLVAGAARAADVTLAWDANQPTPDGYRVFQCEEGQTFDYTKPVWAGTATTCTVGSLEGGKTYLFVVRAFEGDDESGDSNQVSYTPPVEATPDTSAEQDAPGALVIVSGIQASLNRIEEKVDTLAQCLQQSKQSESTAAGEFCGNPTSLIYHEALHWCGAGAVKFDSSASAEAAGFRPCGVCQPDKAQGGQ